MDNKIKNIGTAKISIDNKTFELPVMQGSLGAPGIDVRALHKHTGHFTFDPGYTSTCSTESQITFIDGQKGKLLHLVTNYLSEQTSLDLHSNRRIIHKQLVT